jgi:branched-chain amino acid aminotransferase
MTAEDRLIWYKGEIMPAKDACVSILSPTAQYGLNVFEGIRGYWSDEFEDVFLFRLPEHLKRLAASCRLIGFDPPYAMNEVADAIRNVLRANSYRCDVAVRASFFVDGEGSWSSSDPVCMFIAPVSKPRRNTTSDEGARAVISTYERIDDRAMPPRIKAGANYINGRYAHLEAQAAGYDLPILLDRGGKVSEGAGACLMMVREGVLVTPPTSSSILESITRNTLLTLAAECGVPTDVRVIDRTELYLAEELFLCGSAAEITPLVSIDRFTIGDGTAGPVARKLLSAYFDAASGGRVEWLTPIWRWESNGV